MQLALGFNQDATTPQINADLDHLQAVGAGVAWLNLDISWAFPTSTTMDATVATKLDAAVNGANSRGMQVALQVHGNPSWIVTAGGHTYPGTIWHGPDNTSERTNWVTCLHNAVNRWGSSKIQYVGIWNEPNDGTVFWINAGGPSANLYGQLLQAAYVDIKATWPTIKLVGHNISRNDIGWIQDAYAWMDINFGAATAAANSYYHNVVGLHPYCGTSTTGYAPSDTSHADLGGSGGGVLDPNYLGYRRIHTETVTKEGGTGKPLVFSEFGYAVMGSGWFRVTDEATRAGYMASAYNLAQADGYVEYFNPYYHRTNETPSDYFTSFNIHATTTETALTTAATGGGGSGGGGLGFFDGITRPRIQILAGLGGTLDPGGTYLHLGTGPGLGTGKLGGAGVGVNEVDITSSVRSVSIGQRGPTSDIDQADPVTATIVVNNFTGDFDPGNAASPYAGQLTDGTPIRVRWSWAGVAYDRFYGELADITHQVENDWDITATFACLDGQEKLGRAYLPVLGVPDRDGDRTGARINYLADQAGYPSALRLIETGYTTLASTVLGESAAEQMAKTAATEFGTLFLDGSGRITFYDRHHGATAARSTTVQATFGDPAGTIPLRDIALARNRDRLFNRVALTREAIPSVPAIVGDNAIEESPDEPVEQVADDPATIATKGVLAFPAQVGQLHRNDHEVLAMAQYLVGRYKTITNRISELNVSTLSTPTSLFGALLGLGPLDRVAVDQDYGPADITGELLIQGVGPEEIGPDSWTLTFTTSPPPPTPTLWTLGTSALGSGHLGW